MKVIDLSHIIEEEMPVFPGTEKPIINNVCTLEKDGFREKLLTMYSHTGTHLDVPAHMIEGSRIDDLDVDHFVGPLLLITTKSYQVTLETLKAYEEEIKRVDFVLLKTNWDRYWGDSAYFSKFPALSKEAAEYLSNFDLKGFGVDAISVDHMENLDFTVHHILLNKGFILIENLRNLDALETGDLLSVLPLKIKDGDGSPIRAIGMRLSC